MTNSMCQSPAPLGLGYLRFSFDEENRAVDYSFLDLDAAFEQITGLPAKRLRNQPASSLSDLEAYGAAFTLSYLERVLLSGKTQETVQWAKPLQRYLRISALPVDGETLALAVRLSEDEAGTSKEPEEETGVPEAIEVMFNSTHIAVSLIRYSQGRYRYLRNNRMHQRYTGFSNIRDADLIEVTGPEAAREILPYYEECMKTGQPVSYEQEFNFIPGRRIWQTEITPFPSGDGSVLLLCASKDITELKEIQRENERLNLLFRAMFDQHSAIKLIFDPASGQIVDANPSACTFYGRSREELRSIMIQDINELPPELLMRKLDRAWNRPSHLSAVPYRLINGETRFLDVYSCPIYDGERRLIYSIIFDVTDREDLRNALIKEKELLRLTLKSIGDGVVTTDNSGRITSLNTVALNLTGWDSTEAIGRHFSEVFILQNENTKQQIESPIQAALESGRAIGLASHTELVNRRGDCVPIADSAAPIKDEDGKISGVVMVFRDVGEEKERSRQIEYLSYHDALTGLKNRYYVEQVLPHLDTRANLPFSVIMGDVNGLKLTNDVFGHKAGDSLLVHVAELLQKHCGPSALTARWGGDEFVAFLPKTNQAAAEKLLGRIKNDRIAMRESGLELSISLGCATKTRPEENVESALRAAEEYMYHQKLLDGKSYRNSIINTLLMTLYEKSMESEEHSKRLELYCHTIGKKLLLSAKEMDELSLLALLHDLGKVGLDRDILKKSESLEPGEWEEMRRHPEIGYRIAQSTPELSAVADYILSHHERWDGKGYPRGLRGKDIPLACRILSVADAFDSMTNDRSYRKSLGWEEALSELKQNAGTQFDPSITQLFIDAITLEDW